MLPTIIVASLLGAVVVLIIVCQIMNKKKGKGTCSCGGCCSGCAMSGTCHPKK